MEVRRRGWYNAELEYRDYMVPGILVQLVIIREFSWFHPTYLIIGVTLVALGHVLNLRRR